MKSSSTLLRDVVKAAQRLASEWRSEDMCFVDERTEDLTKAVEAMNEANSTKKKKKTKKGIPTCPECGAARISRLNTNTNVMFVGCSAFPKCTWSLQEEHKPHTIVVEGGDMTWWDSMTPGQKAWEKEYNSEEMKAQRQRDHDGVAGPMGWDTPDKEKCSW